MSEMDMKRLDTWERKISRIHGPAVEQGIWRISDQELREPHKDLDIVAHSKKKRLEWIGHVVGMDQGRTVKKIFEGKPEGSRRGRTRLKWLEDVGKNRRELKVKGWRQKAVDREEWVSVIQQAKALRGPQSQGVSNIYIPSTLMMNYYTPIKKNPFLTI